MQKILIFDFDGTIADTAASVVKIYNKIAKENNLKLISKNNLAALRNKSAMENVRDFGIPIYKLPFIVKKVRTELKNEIQDLKAITGIKKALQLLKNKGYKLYVLSSNSKENIESFLEHNKIEVFDDVYSVSNLFGKHAKLKSLVTANKWNKSHVMYIGDEVRDIEAAKKADIKAVAICWGYNTEEALRKNKPAILLKNPGELSSL